MSWPCLMGGVMAMWLLLSCESAPEKEARLARQYCSSCHLFPEPALLPKDVWRKSVLPEMAFRMGFEDMQKLMALSEADRGLVMQTLPARPMISTEDFEAIKRYFEREAPDTLPRPVESEYRPLTQFDGAVHRLPGASLPAVTLIHADTIQKKLFIGTRFSRLYTLSFDLDVIDSLQLESPPSALVKHGDEAELLVMGLMDPNDQARGSLIRLPGGSPTVIDSLKRPVDVQCMDLNNDGLDDYVICAFGNYTGALLAFENLGYSKYKKHVLIGLPGARRAVVRDLDDDGQPDITVLMTQGDERIVQLSNQGQFEFQQRNLLRFPSVYGSSYFDLKDFNQDGHLDILYTNGDNADFSPVFKPYHGVRVFLNDGKNGFKAWWFHPLHGASQARAVDFDSDGDLDIAAIAFFPGLMTQPERGFVYFENTGKGFTPYTTPLAAAGRWLTMEDVDIDHDGDRDILLGALDFRHGVSATRYEQWVEKKTSLLVLKNNAQ